MAVSYGVWSCVLLLAQSICVMTWLNSLMLLFQANIFDPKGKVYCGATSPTQDNMIGSTFDPDILAEVFWVLKVHVMSGWLIMLMYNMPIYQDSSSLDNGHTLALKAISLGAYTSTTSFWHGLLV